MNKTKRLLISMLTLLCCCTGMWAEGELNGVFTISASGGKVQFSQGNLQYQASTNTWRFATNQYDYIGNAAGNTSPSSTQTAWIDYFNWGTSGYNHGANCYQPWSTSTTRSDYYAYGSSSKNLYDAKDDNSMRGKADWGYNAISNGGNTENSGWRVLTKDEWAYLISSRSETYRYAKGTIHGTNGLMLFPDGFTLPTGVSISNANTTGASYTSYSDETWTALEAAGVVFLPATGLRNGTSVLETGSVGNYWSSTCMNADRVYNIRFDGSSLNLENDGDRQNGFPVRLVKSNLKQDGEGNFLIESVQDWNDFATIVNNGINRTANAKMTANIDLGTDQTMIGSSTYPYGGVFDGQGHTLTVHLISTTEANIAPFRSISNSTIKNLAVAGSVTGLLHSSGLVSGMPADNTVNNFISNVMVSVTITTTATHCGGILGHGGNATTTIQDCLFNGTINGKEGGSTVAAICGWTEGITNIISCLENGTYTNCSPFEPIYASLYGEYHGSYNYYVNGSSTRGTQATTTTLGDGTVTTGLNAGRTGDDAVWVQQGSQPMLKTFAVKTDGSGAYLIGSVGDWIGFSNIVATTPAANAKMTADIDLGDDQTVIGGVYNGSTLFYQGTFDGQGHTLTIAYNNTSGERFTTPFSLLEGATIKNLHLDGTVNSTYAYGGSIASILKGTNTIENVWNSVTAVCTMGGWVQMGGFIGVLDSGATATISDCLYTGSITHNGGYSGYFNGGYGPKPTVNNCLVLGAFTGEFGFNGNYDNCYCKHASTTGVTQPSDADLSDGTTTAALNNGRKGDAAPWVQDPVTNLPQLKLFASNVELTAKPGDNDGEYWATYYHQYAGLTADANTTVYTGAVSANKVMLTEVNDKAIPADNAVILKSTSSTITLTPTNASGTLSGNALLGMQTATAAPANAYCLSKGTSGVGFYAFTGTIPAHRGYLVITSGAPQYLGFDDNGGTTGLNEAKSQTEETRGEFFDLQGRRIMNPTKGLYIVNGRKVVIK